MFDPVEDLAAVFQKDFDEKGTRASAGIYCAAYTTDGMAWAYDEEKPSRALNLFVKKAKEKGMGMPSTIFVFTAKGTRLSLVQTLMPLNNGMFEIVC